MLIPFGATPPITTCPHCSVLVDGSCLLCVDGDPHPSCQECSGGLFKPPWYRSDLFQTVALSVAIGVVTALIIRQIESKISKR